jgi:hypothetical protein
MALAFAALASIATSDASAVTYWTCDGKPMIWEMVDVTLRPMNISFGPGSASRAAIERARKGWTSFTPGSFFDFVFSFTDQTTWQNGDGVSHVAYTDDYPFDSDDLAVTVSIYEPCAWIFEDGSLVETDVLFKWGLTWNKDTNPTPSTVMSTNNLTQVAAHEFGHAMGLKHTDWKLALMNSVYPGAGTLGNDNDPDPHADDSKGARILYGGPLTPVHDIAASAYLRTDPGESDVIPAPASAAKGTKVPVTFTIANRGPVKLENIAVRYYLSTNSFISTSDTYLGSVKVWMSSGFEGSFTRNVKIPADVASGSYFIGILLETPAGLVESDTDNNAVALSETTLVF